MDGHSFEVQKWAERFKQKADLKTLGEMSRSPINAER
jgi:hypothetical protein